jgi:uncharacterized SAM-binding protein YcdF (DUF218 family)
MQDLLTALALPPLGLVLLAGMAGLVAWRGRRWGGMLAVAAAAAVLALATPLVSEALVASLENRMPAPVDQPSAEAIVILGADTVRVRPDGHDVGPLSLERLRAGAALHRSTGLPVLVTGGRLAEGEPPLAVLMAESLAADFRLPARWVEDAARNTRENAEFSAALLRAAGLGSALVVTHAWHMPRALEAYARLGFRAIPAPLRVNRPSGLSAGALVPRPLHLAMSWLALREWAGRAVYALRDGPPAFR